MSIFTALVAIPCASATGLGNVVFIGDSITQGAGGTGNNALSYRYSLWKNFVDNNVEYKPVGSMTIYFNGADTSPDAKTYLGKTFNNTSEGHYGWDVAELQNGRTGTGTTGQGTGGLSKWLENYNPNTATMLMGINDLSRGSGGNPKYTLDQIVENTKTAVQTLQNKNENITVHVYSVLPTNQGTWANGRNCRTDVAKYNQQLKTASETWSTETSKVVYHDITAGFDPTVHCTSDKVHPNAKGELIIAGNMARALGIGQRTAGLDRRAHKNLAQQTTFSTAGENVAISVKSSSGKSYTFSNNNTNTANGWRVDEETGHISLATGSNKSAGSWLKTDWQETGSTAKHEFTVSVTVKMNAISETEHSADNFLGIWLGNGEGVGTLYVGESGIYWGGTNNADLLYGQTNDNYKDKFMTLDANTIHVAWIDGEDGKAASGFYVWLNDQLIGEALTSLTAEAVNYKNNLLIGDIGAAYQTSAEIFDISFDAAKAWAPSSAIPEPSAFGVLAGLGALALVGTRRRRRADK